MAETTKYYGLKCPDKTDYYNVEDQNENMRRIDEALESAINAGVYVGDGEAERFIELPRTPKFVFVLRRGSSLRQEAADVISSGGLAVSGNPAYAGENYIIIEDGGFRLRHFEYGGTYGNMSAKVNSTDTPYYYLWG